MGEKKEKEKEKEKENDTTNDSFRSFIYFYCRLRFNVKGVHSCRVVIVCVKMSFLLDRFFMGLRNQI